MGVTRGCHVAVIGGGITGLAAAHALQLKARETGQLVSFTLFERDPELGGKIRTEERDGFVIEAGPDSFVREKPWAAQLAQDLGLEPELIGSNPRQRQVYVVNRGRLEPMPDGMMLVIPTRFMPFITSSLISLPGKIRMGMDYFIPPRPGDDDESMGAFFRRRLGQEALDKLAEPLLSGIHVSDPDRQSMLATFPRFRTMEKQHGSLIRGVRAGRRSSSQLPAGDSWKSSTFVTLRGGLVALIQALENALEPGQVVKDCPVAAVQADSDGGYRVVTAGGNAFHADAVILATPAGVASELVSTVHPRLSARLKELRCVSTATVSLAYPRAAFAEPLNGSGFIIPRKENRRITACTWSSNKFAGRAPEDTLLIRCFFGGPGREHELGQSDEELVSCAHAELAELMGAERLPFFGRVFRWVKGNPQYEVGHLERVKGLRELCADTPGITLAGAAYDGVGIPDCVRQGQQAAGEVLSFLRDRLSQCSSSV